MSKRKRKPNGYWTYERCKEEALKYDSKKELYSNNSTVSIVIWKNKWVELISHFNITKNPTGYWTYDKCKKEALKYKTKSEIREKSITVYNLINKNKWLDLFEHFEIEVTTYWTYERCKEEALKYENVYDFYTDCFIVYNKIRKNKWLELTTHQIFKNKPSGYWTYERCKEEALKYNNSSSLEKGCGSVYNKIRKNKWVELTKHFKTHKKPSGYWTYERCKEEALKYNTKSSIRKSCVSAYNSITRNKWTELTKHFKSYQKPSGYWTYDRCKKVALSYDMKGDLTKDYASVLNVIRKNKWDELIKHLKTNKIPSRYWTYDKCKEEALKYKTKSSLEKGCSGAYRGIIKNNWIKLFKHMIPVGNRYKRMIYVFEFDDNHCYVGLTGDIKRRKNQHLGKDIKSSVYKHMIKYNKAPKLIHVSDYISVEDAIIKEKKILDKYINNGWCILNKVKTGGIGGKQLKWTYKKCKIESLKYDSLSKFRLESSGCYSALLKNGWVDELCSHIKRKKTKNGYWNNYNLCEKEALKYVNRSSFIKGCWSAYTYSAKNNWLDIFYPK